MKPKTSDKINGLTVNVPAFKEGVVASLSLLLLAFIIYGRTIGYGYVLDDSIVITENIYTTRGIKGIPDLLTKETFEGYFKQKTILVEGGRYRPASLVTFAMEWSLFAKEKIDNNGQPVKDNYGKILYEGNPHISHSINILLYAVTAILIYFLLFNLFRHEKERWWLWNIPFAGALIFTLHPIHIEAVANIKGRDEILAMLMALLALYCSIRYIYTRTFPLKVLYMFCSGLFFLFGLLSKENAITFLAVIPLTIYFFTPAKAASNFRAVIPLLTAAMIYMIMRMKAIGDAGTDQEITDLINNPFYGMPLGDKYATILYTLLIYIKLLLYPNPLTSDYWPYHIPWMTWSDYRVIIALVVYIILAIIAWRGFRKKWIISYCILFFIITLSVTSNIFFPVGSFMNERFLYMSSLAFCILVAYFLIKVIPVYTVSIPGKVNYIGMILFAVLLFGFILKTWQRVPDWKDEMSLNYSDVKVSKNSARANCFWGVSMYRNSYLPQIETIKNKQKNSDFVPSKADTVQLLNVADSINAYLTKALSIYPVYHTALTMKCGIAAELNKLGKYDLDRLLAVYDTLLNTGKDLPFIKEFTSALKSIVLQQLQSNDPETHEQALLKAKRLKEFYLKAYHLYSEVHLDNKKSLEYLQLAVQISPDDILVRQALSKEQERNKELKPVNPGL